MARRNKSSNELALKDKILKTNHEQIYNNLKTDILNNEKFLFDFISDKNKIKLFSYFDKKGAKKFLSEKDKAMKKITLFDEILDENASTKKIHKDKKLKKKARRSISDNLSKFKIKKSSDKKISTKNIKKSQMVISINYIDDGKNNDDKTNLYSVNKKAVTKYNSISSNYSNIMPSSPKNLIMNKNDSLIFSIVSEMSKN
jgi:hypothetical protein